MLDITYPPIILTAKATFKAMGLRFQMSGTEHVPRSGGVLLACNHIGYADFVFGGLAANPSGRRVRFMAKREIFEFIETWYNRTRRHSSLGYLSPEQFGRTPKKNAA